MAEFSDIVIRMIKVAGIKLKVHGDNKFSGCEILFYQ